jgi:peptidoglycan/LPS O-acetylase OafA/YrhL
VGASSEQADVLARGEATGDREGASGDSGVRGAGARRLLELDGVRGLAALSVMCGHWLVASPTVGTGPVNGPLMFVLHHLLSTPLAAFVAGSQMVILFFVLSGMVLALPRFAGRKIPYGRYLLARALRLYPAVWTAAALSVLVFVVVGPHMEHGFTTWVRLQFDGRLPSSSIFHAVGVILPFDTTRLDGPMWSLEQELRMSVLLPLLVFVVRRYHAPVVFSVAIVLIVEGTASTYVLSSWQWTPVAAGCFLLGILLARHREALDHRWAAMPKSTRRLVGLGILLAFWIPNYWSNLALIQRFLFNLIPALGACAFIVAAQGPGLRQRLSARVPAWLGRISYSLYLVHVVVMHLVLGLRPAGVGVIDLAPLGIALSLALATLMQHYVEAPGIALGRRLARPRAKPRLAGSDISAEVTAAHP